MPTPLDYSQQLETVSEGYDRKTCWVHARAGVIPPATAVITTQKLRLTGSDIFYGLHDFRSDDFGRTWTGPAAHEGFARRLMEDGVERCVCDATPAWHAAAGKLLLTGHTAAYKNDELARGEVRRYTAYSVYDPDARAWSDMRTLHMPDEEHFFNAGAGSTQRVDLPDGTILLPIYFGSRGESGLNYSCCLKTTVVRCEFDGEELRYIEHGDELVCNAPRGFCEPSLAQFDGRFFLTMRNDEKGYVAQGDDGLQFGEPRPWTFDDGRELGSYNTQQHWVAHSDALFLVYTRRGANNDHVFRHRAPLFMAQIDPDRLCVIRETERIVVPEHGARLGNFGTVAASENESWIVVSEWMQTTPPNPFDSTVCEQYGSNNRIFVSRILWERPNAFVVG